MNTTTLFAPLAVALGIAAAPASAHGEVTVGVAVPPVVMDVGGVKVIVGQPPPPPPVVVVEDRRPDYVVVRERPVYVERDVVVVHDRRPSVVYVEDDGCHKHYGKHKHKHGHGHGHAYGHVKHAKYRR